MSSCLNVTVEQFFCLSVCLSVSLSDSLLPIVLGNFNDNFYEDILYKYITKNV